MKPYWSGDGIDLYLGDCREITEWLAADVLVTDPPYGIGWEQPAYLTVGKSAGTRTKAQVGIQNDSDLTARDAALDKWGDKPGLVFGAIEMPFPKGTRRVLAWRKPADAGLFGSIIWRKDWEPVFMVGKWPQIPATLSSVVSASAGSTRQYAQGVHPHAKPVDMLENLIRPCPPGIIADPFAGSGSTLVAAKLQGRNAIGVELEERYCEIAARRLDQGVLDFGDTA